MQNSLDQAMKEGLLNKDMFNAILDDAQFSINRAIGMFN